MHRRLHFLRLDLKNQKIRKSKIWHSHAKPNQKFVKCWHAIKTHPFCHQFVTINQLRKKNAALVILYAVIQVSEKPNQRRSQTHEKHTRSLNRPRCGCTRHRTRWSYQVHKRCRYRHSQPPASGGCSNRKTKSDWRRSGTACPRKG